MHSLAVLLKYNNVVFTPLSRGSILAIGVIPKHIVVIDYYKCKHYFQQCMFCK